MHGKFISAAQHQVNKQQKTWMFWWKFGDIAAAAASASYTTENALHILRLNVCQSQAYAASDCVCVFFLCIDSRAFKHSHTSALTCVSLCRFMRMSRSIVSKNCSHYSLHSSKVSRWYSLEFSLHRANERKTRPFLMCSVLRNIFHLIGWFSHSCGKEKNIGSVTI